MGNVHTRSLHPCLPEMLRHTCGCTCCSQDAFDDDDTLTYDPETTGAIILGEREEAGWGGVQHLMRCGGKGACHVSPCSHAFWVRAHMMGGAATAGRVTGDI